MRDQDRPVAALTIPELLEAIAINSDLGTHDELRALWGLSADADEQERDTDAAIAHFALRNDCMAEVQRRFDALTGEVMTDDV